MSVLSEPMAERINEGFYARAGGYDLFCRDLEDIVNQYNLLAYKEVKVINLTFYSDIHTTMLQS